MEAPIRSDLILAAWSAKIADNSEQAKAWYADATSGDPAKQKSAMDMLERKFGDFIYALYGEEAMMSKKAATGKKNWESISAGTTNTAVRFDNLSNVLNLDMAWMQFFTMAPAFGEEYVDLSQITYYVSHKEYAEGAKIENTPGASLSGEKLSRKRWGGANSFLRLWAERNGVIGLNRVIQAHTSADMKRRALTAYTALGDTTGVTVQSFAVSIIETLNAGADAMLTALNNAGYDLQDSAGLLLLSHSSNRPAINAALKTIQGENGNNILLDYNIQPVYTRNTAIAKDLGLGGANRAMLILPGFANIWADFDTARIERTNNPRTDAIDIVYQTYYNLTVRASQKRVITLA